MSPEPSGARQDRPIGLFSGKIAKNASDTADEAKLGQAERVLALAQATADQAIADAHLQAERILAAASREADLMRANARGAG